MRGSWREDRGEKRAGDERKKKKMKEEEKETKKGAEDEI